MYYHGKGKENRCGHGRLLRKLKPYVARGCHAEITYLNDLLPVLVFIHSFALLSDSVQCLLCSSSSHQGVAGHCCKWLNKLAQLLWLSVICVTCMYYTVTCNFLSITTCISHYTTCCRIVPGSSGQEQNCKYQNWDDRVQVHVCTFASHYMCIKLPCSCSSLTTTMTTR